MGWNYLSIPKLQWCHCWSLGRDKLFHPTLYNGCNYLSMQGLNSIHVSKRAPVVIWLCKTGNMGYLSIYRYCWFSVVKNLKIRWPWDDGNINSLNICINGYVAVSFTNMADIWLGIYKKPCLQQTTGQAANPLAPTQIRYRSNMTVSNRWLIRSITVFSIFTD